MKKTLLIIIGSLLILSNAHGQTHLESAQQIQKLKKEFAQTLNNKAFINTHSIVPYQEQAIIIRDLPILPNAYHSPIDSLCFIAQVGDVLGPFQTDSTSELIKVIGFRDGYFMRVSHILLSYSGSIRTSDSTVDRSKQKLAKKGDKLFKQIQLGADFAKLAVLHCDDNSASQGGDLGWFPQGVMVEEFEKAILQHKKGDVFTVWTVFGFHIVKITEDFKRGKQKAIIVKLIKHR
jgi:peptidyl-prolyl cis-trans isomerase D